MVRRLFDLSEFDPEETRRVLSENLGLTEGIHYQCEKRFGEFGRSKYARIIVSADHIAILIRMSFPVDPITT